jgi:hypothetical protein
MANKNIEIGLFGFGVVGEEEKSTVRSILG